MPPDPPPTDAAVPAAGDAPAARSQNLVDAGLDAMAEQIRLLARQRATGELAALRRLDPERPDAGAFFRLLARSVPEPLASIELLSRWGLAAWAMAQMPEALVRGSLGQALAKGSSVMSEARVNRLLATRGSGFRIQVRRMVRILAAVGAPLPYRQLGRLVLDEGRDERWAEVLRLSIARDYWRARRRDSNATTAQGDEA